MSALSSMIALRARWILPIAGPPIEGGVISIAEGRIAAVGENLSDRPATDLGDVAILPGHVNAHTHLEFSELTAPLGAPGEPLPSWIRRVIEYRRSANSESRASITRGLAESLSAGVTTIGEISTSPWQSNIQTKPDVVVFQEHIGLSPERIASRATMAREHLQAAWPQSHIQPGLSPHAPYTVHPDLLEILAKVATERHVPLAMHLAESREELELLQTARGPFYELLTGLGAWSPGAISPGSKPLDYLRRLAQAPRTLVIHGNYLDDEERQFLATNRARMSLVYCPRTHAYFGHDRYPLAAMLQEKIHIALGTDSRASNPDLDLWREVRFVADRHADVSAQTAVELATICGAEALGLANEVGTLEKGKAANLAIFNIDASRGDPYETVLASNSVRTIWRGTGLDSLVSESGGSHNN